MMEESNKLIERIGHIIDENGYIVDSILVTCEKEGVEGNVVTVPQPDDISFYKRRWDGVQWVEGETAEEKAEREAQQMLESLKPSQNEIEDAELEIKMITMLTEMGVIQ